jgi:hypothetical protein
MSPNLVALGYLAASALSGSAARCLRGGMCSIGRTVSHISALEGHGVLRAFFVSSRFLVRGSCLRGSWFVVHVAISVNSGRWSDACFSAV